MNPQIQQFIQDEVTRQVNASRDFNVVFHGHTGEDSPQILGNDIDSYQLVTTIPGSGQNGKFLMYKTGEDFGILFRYQQTWVKHSFYLSEVNAYNNASQSIPDTTETTVAFNTEIYDTSSEFNTTTHAFTAKTEGKYMISTMVTLNGDGIMRIKVNGATQVQVSGSGSIAINEMLQVAVGDVIIVTVFQSSGGSLTLSAGRTLNYFTLKRLS